MGFLTEVGVIEDLEFGVHHMKEKVIGCKGETHSPNHKLLFEHEYEDP